MFFFKRQSGPAPDSPGPSVQERRNKRILYTYPVDMIIGENRTQGLARTLSVGGIYVAAPFELPMNTLVHLRIGTENRYRFIQAYGSVVYTQNGDGMGIKFVRVGSEDQKKIQSIIDKSGSQEV